MIEENNNPTSLQDMNDYNNPKLTYGTQTIIYNNYYTFNNKINIDELGNPYILIKY